MLRQVHLRWSLTQRLLHTAEDSDLNSLLLQPSKLAIGTTYFRKHGEAEHRSPIRRRPGPRLRGGGTVPRGPGVSIMRKAHSGLPIAVELDHQRRVIFKPERFETLIKLARSYFSIPRGKTLAVSVKPGEYNELSFLIHVYLDESTPRWMPWHRVPDTTGPASVVQDVDSAEEDVWKALPSTAWEIIRDELIKSYDDHKMTLDVHSTTGRRYKLRADGEYSATTMTWMIACVENWEGYKFKIFVDSTGKEIMEKKCLADHGLKDGDRIRVEPRVAGNPGPLGQGRNGSPFANVTPADGLLEADYPLYPDLSVYDLNGWMGK